MINNQRKLFLSRNGPYLKFAILEVFIFANVISSSAFFLQQIVPEYSSHYNPKYGLLTFAVNDIVITQLVSFMGNRLPIFFVLVGLCGLTI